MASDKRPRMRPDAKVLAQHTGPTPVAIKFFVTEETRTNVNKACFVPGARRKLTLKELHIQMYRAHGIDVDPRDIEDESPDE